MVGSSESCVRPNRGATRGRRLLEIAASDGIADLRLEHSATGDRLNARRNHGARWTLFNCLDGCLGQREHYQQTTTLHQRPLAKR